MIVRIKDRNNVREVDLTSFGKDVVSFGRQPDCDIVLNTDTISRVHGAFYYEKGIWIIEDLKSKNGITMDGGKVQRATAKAGREFVLYNSKEKGTVSFTILSPSKGVAQSKPVGQNLQPLDNDDSYNKDYSYQEDEAYVETPKKSKKIYIILGAVAAVVLIAVVAVLLNVDWMSKEEKAYYEYLAELVSDADCASEVNIVVDDKDKDIHYDYYAIADFDGDEDDELFIQKSIFYEDYRESVGEFYEYVDGEVKQENTFGQGSYEFPYTFYDNGVVKAGDFEYNSTVYYAGVHDGYLEDIGLLPLDGEKADIYKSYDGSIAVECYDEGKEQDSYWVWSEEWDEMTVLSDKEYKDIFEFDAQALDVEIHEFDVEVIADKNGDDVTDYKVYEDVKNVDECEIYSVDEEGNKIVLCGGWGIKLYDESKTAVILEHYGPKKEVEIPKELCGYAITGIEGFCCEHVEKVTIPEGIELIGEHAFYGLDYLSEVDIPGSVKEIGEYAFAYCSNLEKVVIPEGVELIEDYAFCGNDNLTVELPDSLEKLHKKAIGYNPNYDGGEDSKDKNCTIIGSKDSIAEEYAEDNDFKFEEKE